MKSVLSSVIKPGNASQFHRKMLHKGLHFHETVNQFYNQLHKAFGHFNYRNILARGANGIVYNMENGTVLKVARGNADGNEYTRVPVGNFPTILKVIKQHGGNRTAIHMTKVGQMSLNKYLKTHTPKTELNKQYVRNKIANAVKKMHAQGVHHGDLHSGNIMVDVDAAGRITKVYIIDFGRSSHGRVVKNAKEYFKVQPTILSRPHAHHRLPDRFSRVPNITAVGNKGNRSNMEMLWKLYGIAPSTNVPVTNQSRPRYSQKPRYSGPNTKYKPAERYSAVTF